MLVDYRQARHALLEVEKMRRVLVYLGEDGYWVAACPSLPGCVSQGETKEAAIENS
jgi:predicted RNase H-like HicB family nuclease